MAAVPGEMLPGICKQIQRKSGCCIALFEAIQIQNLLRVCLLFRQVAAVAEPEPMRKEAVLPEEKTPEVGEMKNRRWSVTW